MISVVGWFLFLSLSLSLAGFWVGLWVYISLVRAINRQLVVCPSFAVDLVCVTLVGALLSCHCTHKLIISVQCLLFLLWFPLTLSISFAPCLRIWLLVLISWAVGFDIGCWPFRASTIYVSLWYFNVGFLISNYISFDVSLYNKYPHDGFHIASDIGELWIFYLQPVAKHVEFSHRGKRNRISLSWGCLHHNSITTGPFNVILCSFYSEKQPRQVPTKKRRPDHQIMILT